MVFVEIPRHRPVDVHQLLYLIDGAPDQVQGHCLHDQKLYVYRLYVANLSDVGKWNRPLVFAKLEDHFKKGNNSHFLLQVSHFLDDVGELANVVLIVIHDIHELLNLALA